MKRVLIAEDEESIVASLEFLMRQCGFQTRVARDGEQAIACNSPHSRSRRVHRPDPLVSSRSHSDRIFDVPVFHFFPLKAVRQNWSRFASTDPSAH